MKVGASAPKRKTVHLGTVFKIYSPLNFRLAVVLHLLHCFQMARNIRVTDGNIFSFVNQHLVAEKTVKNSFCTKLLEPLLCNAFLAVLLDWLINHSRIHADNSRVANNRREL